MTSFHRPDQPPTPRDDGPDSLREWRLRAYMDHLEDLGYDLDSGTILEDLGPGAGASAEASVARAR